MPAVNQNSLVDIGYGTEIRIGRGSSPDWTYIYGGKQASVPDQVPDDIDVTHFQSPGRTKETKPGMKSVADWSFEIQYWAGSDHDLLLVELADLTAVGAHEIVLLGVKPNGGPEVIFQAYVNKYIPNMSTEENQMVTVELKVMARVFVDAAPTNTLLPSISGIAQVGQTLTALPGTWTGAPTFTYQWQEDDGGGYDDISGATSATMEVVVGSLGYPIQVIVTATNTEGSDTATSAATADVIAA